MENKLLIVAAHPDDEVLMCGGTAKKLSDDGYQIETVILGEGITSRDNWNDSEIEELHRQAVKANKIIGSERVHIFDFPDNKFDSVALLDIVKTISKVKSEFKPSMIITHYRNDLNIDHRRTYDAVITATRPMEDETVKTILSGEVLSSTEWQYPKTFSPNIFYNINNSIQYKLDAMKIYDSELRDPPHPRSLEGIMNISKQWGISVGTFNVEAFELVRMTL